MPVIDLTEAEARGSGQLNKFSVKADGRDDASFTYEMQLVFVVASSAEAETVERLIPGAKETYQRATERDDWKAQQTVEPDIKGAYVQLSRAADGMAVVQGGAEIRSALLRASKRAVTLTVKVQCSGQTEQVATSLTKLLRNPVELLVTSTQQHLFRNARVPLVQFGSVLVAKDQEGKTVWGRVHDIDHEAGFAILDVFGERTMAVPMDSVTTAWALVPGDPTEKAIRDFVAACKKAKVAPSYRAITVAVGEAYAGEPSTDGQHRLTPEVVARAVALTKEGTGEASSPPPRRTKAARGDDGGKVVRMHGRPAEA